MIETIKVKDLSSTAAISKQYQSDHGYTAWASAVDPDHEGLMERIHTNFQKNSIPHVFRFFLDMDKEDEYYDGMGPDQDDIQIFVNFFQGLKNQDKSHKLGINCYAGISRSTALAMIAWMVCGYQPEVALEKVLWVRSVAWPNIWMLEMYDNIAGTNSVKVIEEWRKESYPKGSIVHTPFGWNHVG